MWYIMRLATMSSTTPMQRNIALDDSAVPAVVEPPHVWLSTLHSFEIGDFRFVVLKLLISAYVDFASHVASSSLLGVNPIFVC